MLTARRVFDAVTPGRIIALLLLGGFAEAFASLVTWLLSTASVVAGVPTVHALVFAGFNLAITVGVIYLGVRLLGRLFLGRRRDAVRSAPSTAMDGSQKPDLATVASKSEMTKMPERRGSFGSQ